MGKGEGTVKGKDGRGGGAGVGRKRKGWEGGREKEGKGHNETAADVICDKALQCSLADCLAPVYIRVVKY